MFRIVSLLKMVLLFRILISLLDFLFMCMWASWYFCRGQRRTCGSQDSISTVWVLGIWFESFG